MVRSCLAAMALLVLVGCSTSQPIYNVENAAVFSGSGAPPTQDKIRRAIIVAATSKGWAIKDMGAGQLLATLNVRNHMAEVLIAYSTRSYSITYRDSHTLDHDGEMIHRNYNKWVRTLERLINQNLSVL